MKLFIPCLLAMLLAFPIGTHAQCALDGYTYLGEYGGSHYYMSNAGSSWDAANAAATAAGGHLAAISSQGENDFLAQALIDAGAPEGGRAWIGLNDAATEGVYTWTNGEPYGYTNWGAGEPNNAHYYPGDVGEDWTEINLNGFGKWNDLPEWVTHIPHALEMDGTDDDCDGLANYCDESFDDADCDGIGDACDAVFNDADCDGTGDGCDNCPGGDDNGPCNATTFPGLDNIPADWICHSNGRKVFVCHNGNTICVSVNAVQAHLNHGDFLGPCTGCVEPRSSSADLSPDLQVFPNPATDNVYLRLSGIDEPAMMVVYNQFGHRVHVAEVPASTENISVSVDRYPAGMYYIQVAYGQELLVKRFIIAR